MSETGRATKMLDASMTAKRFTLGCVVMTQAVGMKDAWYLACRSREMSAKVAFAHYGKRFSTEENFCDVKEIKDDMGLLHTPSAEKTREFTSC